MTSEETEIGTVRRILIELYLFSKWLTIILIFCFTCVGAQVSVVWINDRVINAEAYAQNHAALNRYFFDDSKLEPVGKVKK